MLLQLVIVHQNGAEGQAEIDVVFVHILLNGLGGQHFSRPGEVHIAAKVNIAGLGISAFHPLGLTLVNHRAKVPEPVEVTGGGHHRVDGFRHFRGQVLDVGAVLASGQMPPELGGILYLDFREGVHGIVVNLLPGDGENGLVQIVADNAVIINLLIRLKIGLLTVQHPLGLL